MSIGSGSLELQLRALPGVVAAGFDVDESRVIVQLLLDADADEVDLRRLVADLTVPASGRAVSIEISWLEGPPEEPPIAAHHQTRVRLSGVWTEAITGTLKVELQLGPRVGEGSSAQVGANAGAEATLAALNDLGANLAFLPETASGALADTDGYLIEVALQDQEGGRRYGIASAHSVEVAAARATLGALDRYLSKQPTAVPPVDLTRAPSEPGHPPSSTMREPTPTQPEGGSEQAPPRFADAPSRPPPHWASRTVRLLDEVSRRWESVKRPSRAASPRPKAAPAAFTSLSSLIPGYQPGAPGNGDLTNHR